MIIAHSSSNQPPARQVRRITAFNTGFCTHPSCVVEQGSGLASAKFVAMAILLEYEDGQYTLFDTGYADHFNVATRKLPEKLYALATPAHTGSLVEVLHQQGIDSQQVQTIVLSHFHADHIAGAHDFPESSFLCDGDGYAQLKSQGKMAQVLKGFLPALLPHDFEARTHWVSGYEVPVSSILGITLNTDLMATPAPSLGGYLVSLPGHAAGQLGLLVEYNQRWVFLCADAFWTEGNLQGLLPSKLTHLIIDDAAAFKATLSSLAEIKRQLGEGIDLICSHDPQPVLRSADIEYL